MGVRNCADLGTNFQIIVKRLLSNDRLVNLLYYQDKDPLSQPILTDEEKLEKIYGKLIKFVPRVGPKEVDNSVIALRVVRGDQNDDNNQFKDIQIAVESFVPLTQWTIRDENLRPFAIMGEIQKSLNGKTINGLGKMVGGDFQLNFLTNEISCYEQVFWLTSYD